VRVILSRRAVLACFGADVCAADPLCQSHFTTPDIGDWESRGVRVLQVVETARAVVATVNFPECERAFIQIHRGERL
jgi:hypothetical protein